MSEKHHIEKISSYNDKISIYNLVYKKFKFKWWVRIIIPPLIPTVASFILLFCQRDLWILLTFPLMVFFSVVSINYMIGRVEVVIRTYYSYALNDNNKYNYDSFLEIQKQELFNLLGNTLTKKDNLLFLIDKLSTQQNKYSYGLSVQTVVITISIITGSFLSKFLDYSSNMQDFYDGSRILISVLLLIGFTIIIVDIFLVKGFVKQYIKNRNRLVRTLTNIYLDKYIE
ncbi:hypothetical protein C1637_11505 [Chryseobacterium lactis]|uniref:ABC transporter ATP-binding protein n=1 Tax=Chryseobacterium lactis TaxID=1241981 RepID=A0A3G6RS12_CHRLC|nr:hypothetical protein [Chryseobacterium lactis]AZA80835.1 hypothetical protein EG342_02435 [Chryseobacterium lactis]AZB05837.1 hypothetical protein EG341_18560 [Chryseobacterium lactis]PNW13443.1 hypothetical protein C1637_11505 [Chryseobacterium lactis]